MKKTGLIFFLLILPLYIWSQGVKCSLDLKKINWESKELHQYLTWKKHHFKNLFDKKQVLNVLIIETKHSEIEPDIIHVKKGFKTTSRMAESLNALAAVNGSFFDTKNGGSAVFLQINNCLIHPYEMNNTNFTEDGAVAVSSKNEVKILTRPTDGWKKMHQYEDVLAAGPVLIDDDQIVQFKKRNFNMDRHPRTAIGITDKGKTVLITVDGRSDEAAGMSIPELATIMQKLGCKEALNLDGGGSTTMWLSTANGNGIVNHPSDNQKFDHKGERAVANCIVFTP